MFRLKKNGWRTSTNLKTRRAYKEDVREFIGFTGLHDYMGLRSVVRSHIISWRKDMERRGLAPSSIRRKLSALSSLFDYLCELPGLKAV
jgi:integrase/recombinase XerD